MAYNAKLVKKRPFIFIFECVFFICLAIAILYGNFYWNSRQGLRAFEAGNYKEAIRHFESAKVYSQYDDGLLFYIGLSKVKLGQFEEGILDYMEALKPTPPDLLLQFSSPLPQPNRFSLNDALGYAHFQLGQHDHVIFYCQNMIVADPKYALAYKILSITLYKKSIERHDKSGIPFSLKNMLRAAELAPDQMTEEDKKFLEMLRIKVGVAGPAAQ